MKKITISEDKRCPACGKIENQIMAGRNRSGTQRCKCKECGIMYTIDPKRHEYPEETRKMAIKMYYSGVSGRGVGKVLNMSKANVCNWIKKNEQNSRG
jgi:transposase-like protein